MQPESGVVVSYLARLASRSSGLAAVAQWLARGAWRGVCGMRNRTPKLLVHCSLLSKRSASASAIAVVIDFAFESSIPSSPRLIWIVCTLDEGEGARLRPLCRLLHRALRTAIRSTALPGTLPTTATPRLQ